MKFYGNVYKRINETFSYFTFITKDKEHIKVKNNFIFIVGKGLNSIKDKSITFFHFFSNNTEKNKNISFFSQDNEDISLKDQKIIQLSSKNYDKKGHISLSENKYDISININKEKEKQKKEENELSDKENKVFVNLRQKTNDSYNKLLPILGKDEPYPPKRNISEIIKSINKQEFLEINKNISQLEKHFEDSYGSSPEREGEIKRQVTRDIDLLAQDLKKGSIAKAIKMENSLSENLLLLGFDSSDPSRLPEPQKPEISPFPGIIWPEKISREVFVSNLSRNNFITIDIRNYGDNNDKIFIQKIGANIEIQPLEGYETTDDLLLIK